MDIKDVSAEINRASQKDRSDPSRRGSASVKAQKSSGDRDHFENSEQLGQVRSLIDTLIQTPGIDQEAVQRGKALLESGELDNKESAAKAAEGFLAEGGGFFG